MKMTHYQIDVRNLEAILLLDRMKKAKKLAENGYGRWHRMEISDSKTGRKAYDQYLRYSEQYDQLEKTLRVVLGQAA
jgi:hypothetical protein